MAKRIWVGKDSMTKNSITKNSMAKDEGGKETILAAIPRAAAELGRAPSRGELRRITGVSHYRVLSVFSTLREAVRAAGLEPNPKGEKISTEDLLADWKRVAEKLGRRPSRAEYVREGRYSAGALTVRFGSWSGVSTAKVAKGAEKSKISREALFHNTRRKSRINQTSKEANHKGHEGPQRESGGLAQSARVVKPDESVLHNFSRVPLAAVPAPVVGMRKVTEEVAQMVVNTLMGSGCWPLAIGSWPESSRELTRRSRICEEQATPEITARGVRKEGDLGPSLAVNAPCVQDDDLMRRDLARRGVDKSKPVMGEPFDRSPMTNAPVNELGVMVLFGMVAARLGLQVESVQGKFPDCVAKRQVAPGKWQHLRIEFEYESKNFYLHGHDPKGCDMIVCWRHNWKECPAGIEVVELCRLFGM
ncbi:MAG TPA: hypothetical protein VGJ51_10315 [Candidatus Angelobacter sp.]